MDLSKVPFILTKADKSFCPDCRKPATLLGADPTAEFDANLPMFWICWECKKVRQAGVKGPLPTEGLSQLCRQAFGEAHGAENKAVADAERIGYDNLMHAAIDIWGAFEITHTNYQPPSKEVMDQVTPELRQLIDILGQESPITEARSIDRMYVQMELRRLNQALRLDKLDINSDQGFAALKTAAENMAKHMAIKDTSRAIEVISDHLYHSYDEIANEIVTDSREIMSVAFDSVYP